MSDESTHARWQPTVEYTADIDPARADAIERYRESLSLPKPERAPRWHFAEPGLAKVPEPTGPYQVLLDGKVLFERQTLLEAAKVALALRWATVRRGQRSWGREELAVMGR